MKKIFNFLIVMMLIMNLSFVNNVYAYDADKAVEYAEKYAKERNKKYRKFKSNCTNFVSQCVHAGGIKMKYPKSIKYKKKDKVYKCKKYWYIKKNKKGVWSWSSTWSCVSKDSDASWWGFYNYMKSKGAKTEEYDVDTEKKLNEFLEACHKGDIIQIRHNENSYKYHSCIVTSTSKSYDKSEKKNIYNIKICYNTHDTLNADFRKTSWKKFGKDCKWTIIHMEGM